MLGGATAQCRRVSLQLCTTLQRRLLRGLQSGTANTGAGPAAGSAPAPEDVQVRCGSSGNITLNIYRPRKRAESGPGSVVLFLPRGPCLGHELPDRDVAAGLACSLPASALVQVNYRHDETHKHPVAVHDTLAAYDWILENLMPRPQQSEDGAPEARSTKSHHRVGVCGELYGGGLATMLALTECHLDRPAVVAAAVNSPTVDWTFDLDDNNNAVQGAIDERNKKPPGKPKAQSSWLKHGAHPQLSAIELSRIRSGLFRKPESYFDPFASPILFFRTAGVDLPPDHHLSDASFDPTDENLYPPEFSPGPRHQTSHRRYPPAGMALRLPRMRISVGAESVLRDQGVELASLMHRSVLMDGARRTDVDGDGDDGGDAGGQQRFLDEDHDRRIELVKSDGLGLWCSRGSGSASSDLVDAGQWLQRALLEYK